MTKLRCCFCQQELVEIQFGEQRYWSCINDKCNESVGFGGNLKLWQELIRTRKALDIIAKEFHKETMPDFAVIRDALKTALEQKEE